MKNLKIKKVKIAKINNLSRILGGNNEIPSYQQTVKYHCIPDTVLCTQESIEGYTCPTTTNTGTTSLNSKPGFGDSDRCTGECTDGY